MKTLRLSPAISTGVLSVVLVVKTVMACPRLFKAAAKWPIKGKEKMAGRSLPTGSQGLRAFHDDGPAMPICII
jgi:hypothetical protein